MATVAETQPPKEETAAETTAGDVVKEETAAETTAGDVVKEEIAAETTAGDAAEAAPEKKDPSTLSDAERKVLRQLEFYFSDSNFRRDNFLRGKAAEDKDGFVPVDTLLTFNRLKSLCNDSINAAVVAGYSSKLVVSSVEKGIRRSNPLPDQDKSRFRTIFASKIPEEATLDTLLSVFSDGGSLDVASVRMRRDRETKKFSGTAFVEYTTEDESKKAETTVFELEGATFEVQSLVSFLNARRKESRGGDENGENQNKRARPEKAAKEFEKGTILYLEGICPEGVDREAIKELLSKYGDVGFVDFSRGDVAGHVRMHNADGASKVVEGYKASKDEFLLGEQGFEMKPRSRWYEAVLRRCLVFDGVLETLYF